MIYSALKFQIDRIKNNRITFLLIIIIALLVLYVGYRHNAIIRSVAYLSVMWFCSFFIDLYAIWRPAMNTFIVRNPKKETIWFVICIIGAALFFTLRFSGILDWEHSTKLVRLSIVSLLIFAFPIALAIILLMMKYKPKELGIRFQGFIVIIPIIAISVLTNIFVSQQNLTWNMVVSENGGILGTLFTGFIVAGLSEEFFRVIGQTRIGVLVKNNGYGWIITTIIWALFHAPKWYSESHDLTEALLGSARIIPIGLMWGYITYRTKSILPAVFVHGTNIWGLQNF
jgi:membrane protease YdiL (CAAX protease family)